MNRENFEKFRKDLELLRKKYKQVVKEIIMDNLAAQAELNKSAQGELIKFISSKTGIDYQYFIKLQRGTLGSESRTKTMVKVLDAYFDFKQIQSEKKKNASK